MCRLLLIMVSHVMRLRRVDFIGRVFFFNDTATTEIYTYLHTLSLHDALPISGPTQRLVDRIGAIGRRDDDEVGARLQPVHQRQELRDEAFFRSEEHTSELQSLMRISYAVFCLKKKNKKKLTVNPNYIANHPTQNNQTHTQ